MSVFYPTRCPIPYMALRRQRGGVIYLLFDDFLTPESAPLTSPRTCEPGPGILTIVDPENNASIVSGYLQYTAIGSSQLRPRFLSSLTYARTAGLCCKAIVQHNDGRGITGFSTVNTSSPRFNALMNIGDTSIVAYVSLNQRLATDSVSALTDSPIAIILRSAGAVYLLKSGGQWKIIFIDNSSVETPLYVGCGAGTSAGYFSWNELKLAQLSNPWDSDYGIATNYSASASAGITTTMEANGFCDATWTAVTGETYELSFRRTDDSNRWIARGSQADGTIKLIQMQAGVETERSSAAQVWANGTNYRISVSCDGQTIWTWVNNILQNSYNFASFNQSATGVKTSHAVSNFATFPKILSGTALAVLEAI